MKHSTALRDFEVSEWDNTPKSKKDVDSGGLQHVKKDKLAGQSVGRKRGVKGGIDSHDTKAKWQVCGHGFDWH